MKGLFKFITLLLCVELIIGPIVPSGIFGIENARAQSCPEGFEFNSTLNRCLTSQQTSQVMNAVKSCPRGDIGCYKSNAENALKDAGAPDRVGRQGGLVGVLKGVGQFAAVAMPVTFAAIGTSATQAKCKSPSFYAMIAGGLALVAGDMMANMGHKKRLKEIKEDWGKIVNPTEAAGDKDKEREASINAQSEAFGMLARSEESLAEAAKAKKKAFTLAFYAFTAAAAISTWEVVNEMMLKKAALGLSKKAVAAAASVPTALPIVTQSDLVLTTTLGKSEAADKKREIEASQAVIVAALPTGAVATEMGDAATLFNAKANWDAAAVAVKGLTFAPPNPAAPAAVAAATLAAGAVSKWVLYKQSTTCTPIGAPTASSIFLRNPNQGIYSYYSNNKSYDIKSEIISEIKIQNSTDLASLFLNQKMQNEGRNDFPFETYIGYKNALGELNEDQTLIELFKTTSQVVMNNINPFPSAIAREENLPGVDESSREFLQTMEERSSGSGGGGGSSTGGRPSGSSGSSGSSSSSSASVDSNAGKTFVAEEGKVPIPWFAILGAGAYFTAKSSIGKKMVTSKARAIFSGVMALMTKSMATHAGEQADAANERAKLLRKMQADFDDASSALYACKSEDRNNPGKANCYCYTPEGGRNQNRGNSQICQKMWGKLSFKPGQYLGGDGASTCVTKSRAADPKCECKKNNSCLRVAMPKIAGFGAGNLNMLNSAMDELNRVNDGSISSAQIDSAGLENKAANLRGLIKKLEDQKGMESFKKDKEKMEEGMLASLQKSSAGFGSSGSGLGSLPGGNMPTTPAQAAQELEKELKYEPQGISGGGGIAPIVNTGAEENLEFGLSEEGALAQETAMAEVMKEDLDFGGNDINSGSKTNIFELLSNRYQRSGMRRLFDEKGETKADEAAKSDIAD